MRVDASGERGTGPLYAMGLKYGLTGVFNGREIGMTRPPTTVAELNDALAKAKAAGITPDRVQRRLRRLPADPGADRSHLDRVPAPVRHPPLQCSVRG